jgi:acyl-coenzyme A thioesterase 13
MCTMSALAPLAGPKFWVFLGGLTRGMNLTYIRDCPVDTEVIIDSTVIQAGRTMALIRGEIKSPDGKIVYVTVDHNKANVGPGPWMMDHEPEPKMGYEPCWRIGDCDSKL